MFGDAAARNLKFMLCGAALAITQTAAAAYGEAVSRASRALNAAAVDAAPAREVCRIAARAAGERWGIPRGLLLAIAQVETGRRVAGRGTAEPWPWSANAENRALFFPTQAEAVAWTKEALLRGVGSIDSGCLQVNLQQHPDAFASVEEAFNPARNADYAARFLLRLFHETGSWSTAVGWYHSRTPMLANPYRHAVEAEFTTAVTQRRVQILEVLAAAWAATRSAPARSPGAIAAVDAGVAPPTACAADAGGGAKYDAWGGAAVRVVRPCAPR